MFTIALSSLGQRGYLAYWSAAVCRSLLSMSAEHVTVKDLVNDTWILPEDVIASLKEMKAFEPLKKPSSQAVINRAQIQSWASTNKVTSAVDKGFLMQD